MSVGFFPLKNVEVTALKPEIDAIFGEQTPLGGTLKIIPIERMNALLVVTTQPQYLREMRTWIDRLDQISATGGSERRLFVYRVQNGKAEHLADMLGSLFGEGSSSSNNQAPSIAPGRSPTSLRSPNNANPLSANSATSSSGLFGASAAPSATSAAPGSAQARDAQTARSGTTPGASSTNPVSSATPAASVKAELFGENGVKVIADTENNALLIMASPAEYQKIETALNKLDSVPLQVLIEASIIEVTLEGDLNYGVQWFLNNRVSGYDGALDLGLGLPASSLSSFGYTLSKDGDVRLLLKLLESESKLNVISTPSVMVRDNQTAKINVGRQVPVRSGQTTTGVGTTTEIIQYRDTGVLLQVTPRVNASGLVLMEINQEVSSVDQTRTSSIDSPTINQRAIESTVAVQSGETIVLGGLIQDDRSLGKSGVPGLYGLPLIGNLFGQTNRAANRTELLVLLTPRAVRSLQEARDVTQELRSKLRGLGP
jgi:general secretion pathway protein D